MEWARVFVEEGIARDLGVKMGDEIVFDVQGVPMSTRVASVRKVEWRRVQPNFVVVFPTGVLEKAPAIYVTGSSSAPLATDPLQKKAAHSVECAALSVLRLSLWTDGVDGLWARPLEPVFL